MARTREREAEHPPGATIKELPAAERPRERLWRHGPGVLSTTELLAILIGTGNGAASQSALDVARRLLGWCRYRAAGERREGEASPLLYLPGARPDELCQVQGVGPAKAVRVLAAVELGRRLATRAPRQAVVRRAADVASLLHEDMRHHRREHFRAVLLNTRRYVLAVETISVGGLDETVVHPREVFRTAIQRSASALILVHNHPSGDPTPSPNDLEVTRRLIEVGRLVGIDVLDHVVLGNRRYASVRDMHEAWFR